MDSFSSSFERAELLEKQAELQFTNGQFDSAVDHWKKALSLQPKLFKSHIRLTSFYLGRRDWVNAQTHLEEALQISPEHIETRMALAYWNLFKEDPALALHQYRELCKERPQNYICWVYRAVAETSLRKFDEAITSFEVALRLDPVSAPAKFHAGELALRLQDLKTGFSLYENRLKLAELFPLKPGKSGWKVRTTSFEKDLRGQTISIIQDQGLGDNIQFLRFCKNLADRGAKIKLGLTPHLMKIFSRAEGVSEVFDKHTIEPSYGEIVPMGSLMHLLGLTDLNELRLKSSPFTANPYLVEQAQAEIKERAGNEKKYQIGICWSGNPVHPWNYYRSMDDRSALELLEKLSLPSLSEKYQLWNLNSWELSSEIEKNSKSISLLKPHLRFDPNQDSAMWMEAIAAWAKSMDLVITVDTMLAHLAATLGVPTWIMIPTHSDWRWFDDEEKTIWYPTAKLYRAQKSKSWSDVIEKVAADLQNKSRNA